MHKHKKSLFMQDNPGNSSIPRTSHRFKFKCKWRKTVFQLAFKALEVLLVVYKSSSAFVRCSRSKTRWCSKREAHLIFVYSAKWL